MIAEAAADVQSSYSLTRKRSMSTGPAGMMNYGVS